MWLIDIRRKSKKISVMAVEAKNVSGIDFDEFIRLSCISAMAIEETKIDSRTKHYSTDMQLIAYIQEKILDALDYSEVTEDNYDKAFKNISVLVGSTGTILRPYVQRMSEAINDKTRLSTEVNFLKGIIYAR